MPFDPRNKKLGGAAGGPVAPVAGMALPTVVVRPSAAQLTPPAGSSSLPAIPGATVNRPVQAFQGTRDFAAAMRSSAARLTPPAADPTITAATPQRELSTRAGNTRWNTMTGANGTSWQGSPGGARFSHPSPPGFLRPVSGPGSVPRPGVDVASPATQLQIPNRVGAIAPPLGANGAPVNPSFRNVRGGVSTTATPAMAGAPQNPAAPVITSPMSEPGATGTPRPLGYGANVNGVATFSDGTGGIPQTMSPAAMARLAEERSITRTDAGALARPLASDTMGGVTPTQGQMVDQRVAQAQLTRPITGSRPTAEQFAAADRNAIAMRDPRSAAGRAAHNLAMDAQYGGTPRTRKLAASQLDALAAGTQQSAALGQQADAASALAGQEADATLANTALQGRNTLANTALEQRAALMKPQAGTTQITADGRVALINPTNGATTFARDADGNPVMAPVKENREPPIYTSAGGAASLQALTNNILGVDPNTGLIADPNVKGGRLPTNEETFAAMQKAQQQLQSLGGGNPMSAAGGPPPGAVNFLKSNPQQRAAFDQKYGVGAAARVLGS